jgi:uncharacterized protein with PQ loop repeat
MVDTDLVFEVLNYISGCLFVVLWIPQLYKAYKTSSTSDLSMIMLVINLMALALLICYSSYNLIYSLLIPAIVGIILGFILVGQKIYYDRQNIPVV